MLEKQVFSIENTIDESIQKEKPKPLFTKSRILFLISVFIVISMPLIYRQLEFLFK